MPSKGGVVVEDDVWIGAQAVLLDGAHVERVEIGAQPGASRAAPAAHAKLADLSHGAYRSAP